MDAWPLLKSDLFWNVLGVVGTWVAAGAILLAWRQLRFEAWMKAQEIWTAPDFTQARGHIFARLDTGNQEWTEEEEVEALQVCRKMDEFAALIAGWMPYLPRRMALRIWGNPLAKAWLVLAPVVERERAKCGWPKKWHEFERVGRSALVRHPEARKRQHPD